eukprot:20958-Heterococcus_DN1.PRE.1
MALSFMNLFAVLVLAASSCVAFAPGAALPSGRALAVQSRSMSMAYVPDGLTPEQWKAIKEKEALKAKNLGAMGTTKFKSRSFQAWHEAGGKHLFPVDPKVCALNITYKLDTTAANTLVKAGKVKLSEVPYMQRGGAWDDSDLVKKEKGIKKQEWNKTDLQYARGGERANQSVNIFGKGANLPWSGRAGFVSAGAIDPIKEQAKWKRAQSPLPPNKMTLARIEKEKAELAKKEAKKAAQLSATIEKEGKRGCIVHTYSHARSVCVRAAALQLNSSACATTACTVFIRTQQHKQSVQQTQTSAAAATQSNRDCTLL